MAEQTSSSIRVGVSFIQDAQAQIESGKSNPNPSYRRVLILEANATLDKAAAAADVAVSQGVPEGRELTARVLGTRAEIYETIAALLEPHQQDATLQKQRRDDLRVALGLRRQITELLPNYPPAWLLLGALHLALGEEEVAVQSLRRVEKLDPEGEAGLQAQKMLFELELKEKARRVQILKEAEDAEKALQEAARKNAAAEEARREGIRAQKRRRYDEHLTRLLKMPGNTAEQVQALRESLPGEMESTRYARAFGEALMRAGDETARRGLLDDASWAYVTAHSVCSDLTEAAVRMAEVDALRVKQAGARRRWLGIGFGVVAAIGVVSIVLQKKADDRKAMEPLPQPVGKFGHKVIEQERSEPREASNPNPVAVGQQQPEPTPGGPTGVGVNEVLKADGSSQASAKEPVVARADAESTPPRPMPAARFRGRVLSLKGALSKDEAERVMRRSWISVRYCFEKEEMRSPGIAGKIDLSLDVGGDGKVTSAIVKDSEVKNSNAETCVLQEMRNASFSRAGSATTLDLQYEYRLD